MLGYRYLFASRVITINASSLSLFFSKPGESCQPFDKAGNGPQDPGNGSPILLQDINSDRQALAVLRDDNVLIIGSGNIVHNLPAFFRAQSPDPQPWVPSYDASIAGAADADHADIINYAKQPEASDAAPDWEHFFPMFYALAAQRDGERAHLFNRHFFPGISMTSIAFGLPQ
jgi:hypothetical protein